MPIIPATDSWTLFALMVAGTASAIWMERRYHWGARLSAPVIALLIAMLLSNSGVMPAEAPAYDFVGDWLVPLAIPLLLLRANIVEIARRTGRLLLAFHIASAGTIAGAVLAFALLKDYIPEAAKAAGIMTASYIGGMVNFVAVSTSTHASGSMSSALIVADNVVMAGLFLVLFWMAASPLCRRKFAVQYEDAAPGAAALEPERTTVDVLDLAISLAVAFGIAAAAMLLKRGLEHVLPPVAGEHWFSGMVKTLATNKFVLLTSVSITAATLFPRQLVRLKSAGLIGAWLLFLYLFTVGLPANLRSLFLPGADGSLVYYLFALCTIMAAANLLFVVVFAKLFRLTLEDIVLASNASIGGPPTAAAMAMSKNWSRLVLPALLAGLYGYIVGTPLGLLVTSLLSR